MSMPTELDVEVEVTRLLARFRLPTASAEMVARLRQAGHHDALEVVAEVLRAG
jgi:hypothetical protein